MVDILDIGKRAKEAANSIAQLSGPVKNKALDAIADALEKNIAVIIEANKQDLDAAEQNGMSKSMLDRLTLNDKRIRDMAQAVRYITTLKDPVSRILSGSVSEEGLMIEKITVPLGVAGIIYEARPNVTVDAAALCLKAGNCCVLRGGKEAISSNTALMGIMRSALSGCGINPDAMNLVEDVSRESSVKMMRMNEYLDVLIPRGGAGLIRTIVENSTVPVIETGTGNCHIYVDAEADLDMAAEIIYNAKTSRPSVCNAAESLLVHKDAAKEFLPMAKKRLDESNVELRGCDKTRSILGEAVIPATEEDYKTEFLDYILAVKVVEDADEAIGHINKYGTMHSEAIVTRNYATAERFLKLVNSAAVYVNASTRFTDGGIFGLGAEIGISTQKLHARGPMGLEALTTIKYIIRGNGQVR